MRVPSPELLPSWRYWGAAAQRNTAVRRVKAFRQGLIKVSTRKPELCCAQDRCCSTDQRPSWCIRTCALARPGCLGVSQQGTANEWTGIDWPSCTCSNGHYGYILSKGTRHIAHNQAVCLRRSFMQYPTSLTRAGVDNGRCSSVPPPDLTLQDWR